MKTKRMNENDLKKIVDRIKYRRQLLGLSFQQLADKTGMASSTLQRYETGKIQNIPIDKVAILAKGLGTTPAYIMGWTDQDEQEVRHDRYREILDPLSDEDLEKVLNFAQFLASQKDGE